MVCQPFCQPARRFVEEGKRWLCLRDRQQGKERDEADGRRDKERMKTASFLLNQRFSWQMDSDGVVPREAEECGPSRWSARFPHDVTDVLMLAKTAPQHPPQEPGHQSAVNYLSNVTSDDG
ncbi:hypothetical protein ACER0C_019906 [Sarotherodon galilaeus]